MSETVIYQVIARKRQSGFKRNTESRLLPSITPRLHDILFWLNCLNYLDTSQIARYFYQAGSRKLAERQLRRLYDAGYINRFPVPAIRRWGETTLTYGGRQTIHYLDVLGKQYLKQQGIVSTRTSKHPLRSLLGLNTFEHTLALNEFLLCANRAASNTKMHFDIVHYDRGNRTGSIQPDSMCRFVIPLLNTGMYCLVELDRGTESSQKIKRKIERYVRLYESGEYFQQFRTTSCRVLFVVADCRVFTNDLPRTEAGWQAQIQRRCAALSQWIKEVNKRCDLFWVAPLYTVTPHNFFRASIWEHNSKKVPLLGDTEMVRKKAESG